MPSTSNGVRSPDVNGHSHVNGVDSSSSSGLADSQRKGDLSLEQDDRETGCYGNDGYEDEEDMEEEPERSTLHGR